MALSIWLLRATGAALLRADVRDYLAASEQRLLRESYFIALITPSVEQVCQEMTELDPVI